MTYQLELEQFQGPLDLLLKLIEGQQLDVSQVSLAQVTDQYLQYLDQVENIGALELADFLVVATKLLVIKSKVLLPQINNDEEDSAEQLTAQLKFYKDYLEASKKIEQLLKQEKFLFSRDRLSQQLEASFSPPPSLAASTLTEVFANLLGRIDYIINLPSKVLEKVVSLKETVNSIRTRLTAVAKINFQDILVSAQSRTEVVVCFMALLELLKKNEIVVNQGGIFDDIMIERI